MFKVTETAAQELKKIKDQVQEQQPGGLPRLVWSTEAQFKLAIDASQEGDQELFCADEKVLVVDRETSARLENLTLDFKQTPRGRGFVFEEGMA